MTYQRIVFVQGDDAIRPLSILDLDGDAPASGDGDDVYESDDGFRLSYCERLGYIGLERVIN